MSALAEYIAAIRELDEVAKKAVRAAERVETHDLQSLKLTAHFIACVADNLPQDAVKQ